MLDVVGSGVKTDAITLEFRVQAGRASSQFLCEYQRRGNVVYPLRVFPFSSASVLGGVISCSILSKSTSCSAIISRTKIAHIHVAYCDARYASPLRLYVKRVRSPNNFE